MLQRILSAILLAVGLVAPSNAFAAEEVNRLELPQRIEVEKGTTELQLPIMLTNADKIAGFQCDLYLPDGFSVATDEYDDYVMDVARTTTKRHSLATRQMSDGALRIVLSSMTNATFSGNSGVVLNITVKVGDNVAGGSYNVNLKNVVLTDPDATRYTSADVIGTIVINKAEGSDSEDNKLELQDEITIEEGTTEIDLPILLTNKDKISGFQCDLYLPDGFSVATDEYDDYVMDVARTTTKRHSLATRQMSDGALRIVLSSMTNAIFSGNSGAVLNITVKVGNNIAAGSYNVNLKNVVLTDPNAARYTSADVTGTILVKEAEQPVTVTAQNLTMVYGDNVPALIYQTEGAELKGTPSLSCEATSTSPVGTYPIVVTQGSVINKKVTYVNGTLTITKAPLTVSVGNYIKKQGDAMPAFTISYNGFKNNETEADLKTKPTATTTALVSSEPGEYDITVSGGEAQNYTLSYQNGKLTVVKADAIIISAKSYTREYGDTNPTFEYTVEGAALDGEPEIICEATATSPVGTYPIIIRKGSVTNYNDSYVNGVLTITKAPLKISVGSYEKKQYDPMPEFAVSYEGFKNNETKDVLKKLPTLTCEANEDSAPGEYPIVVAGAEATNYQIQYVAGKLTVTEPDSYTLTYMVDGEVYQSFSIKYKDRIEPLKEPTKEGYTFSGWSEIPETMPANDAVVSGSFTINQYTVTFKIGDEVISTTTQNYGTAIVAPDAPVKEGYTFAGWGDVAESVPAQDVTYIGFYTVNSYTLTYMVDGEVYATSAVAYGASLTPEVEPTKEGYTFSGWSGIPSTMPAKDVEIVGYFKINKYLLTYKVDGEIVKSDSIVYNTAIIPEADPTKEGYTFSGWSRIPETMPAKDVVVSGSFIINQYVVTFKIGDEVISAATQNYGTAIVAPEAPIKEGHTFAGWGDVASTVPAHDVTYIGSYTVNSYTLTYMVDGEVYETATLAYGTAISPEAEPTKEGYTFSGWDGLPRSMPAKDVIVKGYFTINSYTITYVLDGEVYSIETLEYGAKIVPPVIPGLEDYTIWEDVPATTPAGDITIYGKAKDIIDSLTPVFSNGIGYVYDLNGRKLNSNIEIQNSKMKKGINIIRLSDGTTRKVLVK